MSLLPARIPEYKENQGAVFSDSVLGADGCVYGIPYSYTRFVRLDPKDDSIKELGPDFVNDLGFAPFKRRYGVLANDGFIYVIQNASRSMLKIDTNEGENNGLVESFEVEYQENHGSPMPPCSGVLGPDGYLYFPFSEKTIMRFDIVSRQATFPFTLRCPVALGGRINIHDGRLVALPQPPNLFDLNVPEIAFAVDLRTLSAKALRLGNSQQTSSWQSYEGGVFNRDGHLCFLNYLSQLVRLDTCSGSCKFQNTPCQFEQDIIGGYGAFGSPCLGSDGCIYWPPMGQDRILKYDPHDKTIDFVGISTATFLRWASGVTVPNGKTYFFPFVGDAKQILVVDPFGDFQAEIHQRIENDPLKFGRIFQIEDRSRGNHTLFDVGAKKFGMEIMLQMLDEGIQKNQEAFNRSVCPVSLLAALYEECPLQVIYHLMRTSIGEMKYHLEGAVNNTAEQGEVN